MPQPIRSLGTLTAVGLLTPILALAWTPYGQAPAGSAEPAAGGPGYGMSSPPFFRSDFPPAMPFSAPQGFGWPPIGPAPSYGQAQPATTEAPSGAPFGYGMTPPPGYPDLGGDYPTAQPPAPPEGYGPPAAPGPFDRGAPFSGYGPSAPGAGPGWGAPPSGYGAGAPPAGFFPPGFPMGAPFAGPEGFGMPPAGFPGGGYGADRTGMQVSRRTTEDAYLLDIQLQGLRPDEVQVRTQGRWITIDRTTSAQEDRQEQFDQGRGYARSYSYSSGSASRRMSLPPDADVAAMQRQDGENSILIRFPRTDRAMGYGAPPSR